MTKKNSPKPDLKIEDLLSGDILLFPPNSIAHGGWVGQAIVLLTGGKVSHSAIFIGEIDGELRVAHAAPPGIVSESFKALLESEPGCYVKRYIEKTSLDPVLAAVDRYVDHENPYPFLNLGVLGLLLLSNRFANKTLTNRIFYDFALLVGLKIMKMIEENRHPGKKPMTCSQFAAQCFTDAGEEYDIKFNKLLVQFKVANSSQEEDSLLNILSTMNMTRRDEMKKMNMESVLNSEDEITANFIHLLEKKDIQTTEHISKENVGIAGTILFKALCEAMTGEIPSSLEDAFRYFSTNRNYYVTPDDLLSNTKNLSDVGYIDKTVL